MRRCYRCKSIWVCWNWMDVSNPESVNPNQEWLHECWNCAATDITNGRVTDGVPYLVLKYIGRFFVDNQLFEKNLTEDFQDSHDLIDDAPWEEDTK